MSEGRHMPKYENRLSLGNLLIALQLGAMLVGGGVVYANMTNALSAGETDRKRIDERVQDQEARLRVLEHTVTSSLARIEAQLSVMAATGGEGGR